MPHCRAWLVIAVVVSVVPSNPKETASYPIRYPPGGLLVFFVTQLLGLSAYAHAITNLLDSHVLEMGHVHLHKVLAIDVVVWECQTTSTCRRCVLTFEEVDILAAVDALQPVCNLVFVPVPDSVSQWETFSAESTPTGWRLGHRISRKTQTRWVRQTWCGRSARWRHGSDSWRCSSCTGPRPGSWSRRARVWDTATWRLAWPCLARVVQFV